MMSKRFYQFRRLVLVRVSNDDRFATAMGKTCQSIFIGHATGEAQGIGQGLARCLVEPHATTTNGWTEICVMNGYDGFQAAFLVCAEENLLVMIKFGVIKCHSHVKGLWNKGHVFLETDCLRNYLPKFEK